MVTGFPGAAARTLERTKALEAVIGAANRLGYRVTRSLADALCNLTPSYQNHLGGSDRVKLDPVFLDRMTLLPATRRRGPAMFHGDDLEFPVVGRGSEPGHCL